MRLVLPLILWTGVVSTVYGQLPAEGRTSYSKDERIRIPFELRSGGSATAVKLFVSQDGAGWQEYDSARPGQKREFIFKADREGIYSFATQTLYSDGTSDPPTRDRLYEQRRVVIDRTAPKIAYFRAATATDGSPGVEWDIVDENIDTRGAVRIEFRWPEMNRFETIDRDVPFGIRDQRFWQLRGNDRMQVRISVVDRAANRTESEPVWISARGIDRGAAGLVGGDRSPTTPADPLFRARQDNAVAPAAGANRLSATVHYVKDKTLSLNYNATVGQSGLTRAFLYAADEKLDWAKAAEEGEKAAPPVVGDGTRVIPLHFSFTAPNDGLFHFIIIAENHRGPSRRLPKKGEQGDVQVIVDTKSPEVEILGTRVTASGDRGAVVDIRWKATDVNIAPVPIRLEYRANGKDTWKAITPDWTDNTGQFTWTAPTGEGHEFFIRVAAKDRAGNEGKIETKHPVNIDLAVPTVEYKDVAPGVGSITVNPGSPKR